MLDYKLLEALEAIVRDGGFDRAAQSLFITQSAVSQRLKQLEALTGQVLLVRTTPPHPTPAGTRLIKHLRQVKLLETDLHPFAEPGPDRPFTTLAIGINADSIATWFIDAVAQLMADFPVLLDLRVDDQERTQDLLRNGEVVGCVSTRDAPSQGCRMAYLGGMDYRLYAAPAFARRWFPDGLTPPAAEAAPVLAFNRSDGLHEKLYRSILGRVPEALNTHYLPSSEQFVAFLSAGHACGMLPDQQVGSRVAEGALVDLVPGHKVTVHLYWHCWNLPSPLLNALSRSIVKGAATALQASSDH